MSRSLSAIPVVIAAAIATQSGDAAAMPCYVVYGAGEVVVYQSPYPPVDMSGDALGAIRARWPRATMVIAEVDYCAPVLPDTLADAAPGQGRIDPMRMVPEGALGSGSIVVAPSTPPPPGLSPTGSK